MIGKLKGIIDEIGKDFCLLDVNGVGYEIFCPVRILDRLVKGESATLFIHTHVREDHIHLFGFAEADEKHWFLELNKISGIGAKTALAILGLMTPQDIYDAILMQDKTAFTRVSGVGPKAGQRIVAELKDKIAKIPLGGANLASSAEKTPVNKGNQILFDAVSALENLGYQRLAALDCVKKIYSNDNEVDLSKLITESLKLLAK
jgi:Holliday junction DNA helicase RuvA